MKSPRELGLPFDDWRPGQRLAIRTALHPKTIHTVINAPTGSGKSTIAAALLKLDGRRQVILTGTKGLEDQYSEIFDFMVDVRGMANYECLAARDEFKNYFLFRKSKRAVTCDDGPCRSGIRCALKDGGCLYFDAYREALAAQAPLTNYAYWIAIRRYGRGLGPVSRLTCDEAHALPEELMSACRIEIGAHLVPGNLPKTYKEWRTWASQLHDELKPDADTSDRRVKKRALIENLERLMTIDDTWAWEVQYDKVVFEPVVPSALMPYLADASTTPHLVYLSATISPGVLQLLGINARDVTFRAMRSRFPVSRRPTYIVDSVRMDHKIGPDGIAYWLSRIDKIIKQRRDRKGIIHTVSYARAEQILSGSKYRGLMLAPRRASELAAAVAHFRRSPSPMILVSPSVMTGWNFPYRDAEYQILSKLPFPDTRSVIMQARIKATEGYRDHLTSQGIIQAAGRIMRAEDDQGETFIVDDHAKWYLPKMSSMGLSSEWFDESLRYVSIPPPPPAPLDAA